MTLMLAEQFALFVCSNGHCKFLLTFWIKQDLKIIIIRNSLDINTRSLSTCNEIWSSNSQTHNTGNSFSLNKGDNDADGI